MAKQFKFPDVGEGITEGEVVRWLVAEGETIKADQPLAEIETDKAVVEMPSPYAGTVLKIHAKAKDIVKVGSVLVTIGEKGEAVAEGPAPAAGAKTPGVPAKAPVQAGPPAGGIQATPMVRSLAKDLGVDLASVAGTGPEGRITEADVRSAAAGTEAQPKIEIKIKAKYDFYGELDRIPLRGVRRATAKRLSESIRKAVHVTHRDEADASALVAARDKWAPEAETKGIKLTYLPFIVRAVVEALKAHPMLNSTVDEDSDEIVIKKYYNIGIAVDVPDGLIVPVIKSAGDKTILELAADIRDLAKAARDRTVDQADLKGGTFSLTNVGVIGGGMATPIINFPGTAILATMKSADRDRAGNGAAAIVKTLPLCLSFDHRVIDGAEAARFTRDLIALIEKIF
jgi:pyruvate dehydrogenase E2 component (dihydrolipoamide acetyltransferase)